MKNISRLIKLTFSGDILCYEIQNKVSRIKSDKFDFSGIFVNVAKYLQGADYVCGSLETPLAGKDLKYTSSAISFNTPEGFVQELKRVGFNLLTTANNHCLDRDIVGLKRTIEVLDKMGLDHTGTFCDKDACRYLVKDIGNIKVAFISYTYGTNSLTNECILDDAHIYMVNLTRAQDKPIVRPWVKRCLLKLFKTLLPVKIQRKIRSGYSSCIIKDCVQEREIASQTNQKYIDRMVNVIMDAKQNSDMVVFCLHSGGQFNSEVGDYTQYLVDLLVKNGVDIVIGNHTHSVLPARIYDNNTFVAYSLGNFCFTPNDGYYIDGVYADYSVLVNLYINVETRKLSTVSFSIMKTIKDDVGYSRVFPLYDLYKIETDLSKKERLYKDNVEIINRFCCSNLEMIEVLEEYDLKQIQNLGNAES